MLTRVWHLVQLTPSSFTDDIGLDNPATPRPSENGEMLDEEELSTDGKPYLEQIKVLRSYAQTTLYVDFSHILEREVALSRAIQEQYYR